MLEASSLIGAKVEMEDFEKDFKKSCQSSEELELQRSKELEIICKIREKYRLQRRGNPKPFKRLNDIYIGKKSNIKSQVERCKKLLDTKFNELWLHGTGHAIPRTTQVANTVKSFYHGCVDFTTEDSNKILIDDLIPLDEETTSATRTRNVPTVLIRIFRTVQIPN